LPARTYRILALASSRHRHASRTRAAFDLLH
jgi:hypothetical protein